MEGEGEELRLFRALLGNLCFFSLRAEVSKHADKTKAIAKFLAIALVFALHLWYIMQKDEDRRLFEKVEVFKQRAPAELQKTAPGTVSQCLLRRLFKN